MTVPCVPNLAAVGMPGTLLEVPFVVGGVARKPGVKGRPTPSWRGGGLRLRKQSALQPRGSSCGCPGPFSGAPAPVMGDLEAARSCTPRGIALGGPGRPLRRPQAGVAPWGDACSRAPYVPPEARLRLRARAAPSLSALLPSSHGGVGVGEPLRIASQAGALGVGLCGDRDGAA